eukprot:scaffold26310_cov153-Isochrysis_galbana.AAC.1
MLAPGGKLAAWVWMLEAQGRRGEAGGAGKACAWRHRSGGHRSTDVGVVMNGVDIVGGKCGGEGLNQGRGRCIDDVEDGGESGIALNTPTAAGDIDEFTTGEPKILRDIVGVVGKKVLKEVGVVLFEGVDDGAAVELVESLDALLPCDHDTVFKAQTQELEPPPHTALSVPNRTRTTAPPEPSK